VPTTVPRAKLADHTHPVDHAHPVDRALVERATSVLTVIAADVAGSARGRHH
jgi:hypothetical protein